MAAACGDVDRPVITEPPVTPVTIQLTAVVNVQLGDTPVGQQPSFIITGQARGTRGGVEVAASIDSVVVSYRRDTGAEWTRLVRRPSVPFSDQLPFTVQAGDRYEVRAVLYARAWHQNSITTASDEWVATGQAFAE